MEQPQPAPSGDDLPQEGNSLLERRFLELVREGRPDEAYQLLLANLQRLRGYLDAVYRQHLGGAAGIEELLHAAAWKAVESAGGYRPQRGGLLFWAWRIGVHLARDQIRSNLARRGREREAARPEREDPKELVRSVRAAIDGLPRPYRIILHFDLDHDGRGPAEALAALLRVKVQTVYNWRSRARMMLRRRLQ